MTTRSADSRFCSCGHPQSFHKGGFGACRCGCERAKLHGRSTGIVLLEELEAPITPRRGKPGRAGLYRVRCPECETVYETRTYLRDLATRERCRACSDARRAAKKRPPEERAPAPGDLPPAERFDHGVRARYVSGCRCEPCTDANRVYARTQQKLARMGQGNPLVPAARARRHLEKLQIEGVGLRQAADAAQTARSAIVRIVDGTKTRLRAETERRILAVTVEAKADHAYVDGARARKILDLLLADGFTRGEIARRLGSKAKVPALRLGSDRILVRNEAAVERLYRQIHGKEAPRRGRPLGTKNGSREMAESEAAE